MGVSTKQVNQQHEPRRTCGVRVLTGQMGHLIDILLSSGIEIEASGFRKV